MLPPPPPPHLVPYHSDAPVEDFHPPVVSPLPSNDHDMHDENGERVSFCSSWWCLLVIVVVDLIIVALIVKRHRQLSSRYTTSSHLRNQYFDGWIDLVFKYAIKFVLEVLGAAGAIWGSSEVFQLRSSANSAAVWRPIAVLVGLLFFLRWCRHLIADVRQHYRSVQDDLDDEQSSINASSRHKTDSYWYASMDIVEEGKHVNPETNDGASFDELELMENM